MLLGNKVDLVGSVERRCDVLPIRTAESLHCSRGISGVVKMATWRCVVCTWCACNVRTRVVPVATLLYGSM